jgi:hypothetical protein
VAFVSLITSFQGRYRGAPNEFQQSTLRRERAAELARILPGRSIERWIGKVSSMSTTRSGGGTLAVNPLEYRSGTWSAGMLSNGTSIPSGSPLYQEISGLSVGQKVIFDGAFGSGKVDYLDETSLTELGSMTDPEFVFEFTAVRPADATSNRASIEQISSMPSQEPRTEVAPPQPSSAAEIRRLTKRRQSILELIGAAEGILNASSLSERAEINCRYEVNVLQDIVGTTDSGLGSSDPQDSTYRANVDRCKAAVLAGYKRMPDLDDLRAKASQAQEELAKIDAQLKTGR